MAKISDAISKSLILVLRAYRGLISPLLGNHCRFYPSCSVYAVDAIDLHGGFRGSYLTLLRILRCHPFCQGGYDPVPEKIHYACKHD